MQEKRFLKYYLLILLFTLNALNCRCQTGNEVIKDSIHELFLNWRKGYRIYPKLIDPISADSIKDCGIYLILSTSDTLIIVTDNQIVLNNKEYVYANKKQIRLRFSKWKSLHFYQELPISARIENGDNFLCYEKLPNKKSPYELASGYFRDSSTSISPFNFGMTYSDVFNILGVNIRDIINYTCYKYIYITDPYVDYAWYYYKKVLTYKDFKKTVICHICLTMERGRVVCIEINS